MSLKKVLYNYAYSPILSFSRLANNKYYYQTGLAPMPKVIFLSLNSICNSRCKMCDVGQQVKNTQFYKNLRIDGKLNELPLGRLKKLVDETKDFKPSMNVISTEPLLYKDLFKFAKYTRENGLEIAITTNGILLEKFAEDFVKNDVNWLWVSIDGPAKTHNFIRGIPKIFEKATDGIKKVQEFKKKYKNSNPKLGINYTISNYNYDKIVDFLEAIKNLKPDVVSISHYNYVTSQMALEHNQKYGSICRATQSCVSAVDLKKINPRVLFKQLQEVKKKYMSKLQIGFAPDLKNEKDVVDFYTNPHVIVAKKACRAPWEIAQILANGDFTISTRCYSMSLGNINQMSFREAWNNPKFIKFRKELNKVGMFVPACTRCCAVL